MCAFLYPDEYLDSTYSIDFDQLYKEGYRGITTWSACGWAGDFFVCTFKGTGFSLYASFEQQGAACENVQWCRACQLYLQSRKAKAVRVSQSDGDPWHGHDKYTFCGRSDLYGCVWGKFSRNPHDPCKTDPPERRNPDRVKAPAGGNCAFMLSSAP